MVEITAEDKIAFKQACDKIIEQERLRVGIGTLSEKTVHAVLKHYLVPKEEYHEIRCLGYVADILYEGEIIEIQTANFNTLRRKLDAFLEEFEVTIVYPIPATKWLQWLDVETGEITNKRKSPKKGNFYHSFRELYKIKQYLTNPRLHLRLLLIDLEETRLLTGWSADKKKGSTRFDRIPTDIREELMIATIEDYKQLIPTTLPKEFTSKEFKKESHISMAEAQTALNILTYTGSVKRVGKIGNAILYQIAK